MDAKQEPLFSADVSENLGWVTRNIHLPEGINMTDISVEALTKDQILEEYPDVFTGLGCLPGEYHLEIDKTVKPGQHLPGRVPAAMKSNLRQKI